jgi:hypothetical protein
MRAYFQIFLKIIPQFAQIQKIRLNQGVSNLIKPNQSESNQGGGPPPILWTVRSSRWKVNDE